VAKRNCSGDPIHKTRLGSYRHGNSVEILSSTLGNELRGKVQLILTSPPFPLNKKKSYGNHQGQEYLHWFKSLAPVFSRLLTPNGSIVMELGNAWMAGRPIQSLLHFEALMGFVKHPSARLRLCQHLIVHNPSRLPSPAQWVTVRRIRLTDSFTHIWWMAKTDFPKADNRNVLRPYSASMKRLLERQTYNSGKRPSEHRISRQGFLTRHAGSIPHNLIELEPIVEGTAPRLPAVFSLSNTSSNDFFLRRCRKAGIDPHPARMPLGLAAFFVQFLTSPGDLVLDPFGGSNTTGFSAELLGRRWLSIEIDRKYGTQSRLRFKDPLLRTGALKGRSRHSDD
jgi:DNA modification methylase